MVSLVDPYGCNLGFLDRSRYFFFQLAPHLYSQNWVDTLFKPKSSAKIECTNPVLTPTSIASSRTVIWRYCMTKVRTWSTTLSFRLVEGLPGRGSLSTDVRPCLKQLNHSFNHEILVESSSNAWWILWMVFTWVSPSFCQNLMQYRCSGRSAISQYWQSDERSLHFLIHRPTVTDWCFLRAGKNLDMHMNGPYTTPPKDASQSSFVYAGKIEVRYFLNCGLYTCVCFLITVIYLFIHVVCFRECCVVGFKYSLTSSSQRFQAAV
jgi:hypothetical protein